MSKHEKDTLCWTCKNATGGCSWSMDGIPVVGWDATKTYLASDNCSSYVVHNCPSYSFDKAEIPVSMVCKLLKINDRTFYRLSKDEIINRLATLGYSAYFTIDNKVILENKEVNIL